MGGYFAWKRDFPAIAVALAWLGMATLELAAYMYDASDRSLVLVTPFAAADADAHDFATLFGAWGCLEHAHAIGKVFAAVGYVWVWAALVLILLMLIAGFLRNAAAD